ncbi:hypothetical protein [Loktanella sp. Alg231-35]|uniref:hypothetical protein n=1 Tax=Loktanella sp. Alg231-35 TaxID=1922220 RepID=UPI000D558E08|nr:hypothetical protein [Loktanella sp. Alg231-35]
MANDHKKGATPLDTGTATLAPVGGDLIDRLGQEAQLRMGEDVTDPQASAQVTDYRQRPSSG